MIVRKRRQMTKRKKRVMIPKELLSYYYLTKGLTIKEIAQTLKCSPDTVRRRLNEYKIPKNKRHETIDPLKAIELYTKDNLSMKEIGSKYACSRTTVHNILKENGYPLKRVEDKNLPENHIISQYNDGQSINFLAQEYGVSKLKIRKILADKTTIRRNYIKKDLPLLELHYLYYKLCKSVDKIAKIYKVAPHTVAKRIRGAGFFVYGNRLRINPDDICLKFSETNSITATARHFKCSYASVKKRLKAAGLVK